MKAKLLRDAGDIPEGAEVEVASRCRDERFALRRGLGGRSTSVAPVYNVTDDEGNAEEVDTRDLRPLL